MKDVQREKRVLMLEYNNFRDGFSFSDLKFKEQEVQQKD